MTTLLINQPAGLQALINIQNGGAYFDPARVLWDERTDGALPAIILGGMVRVGNALQFSQTALDAHNAIANTQAAEAARQTAVEAAIQADTVMAAIKSMTAAEYDAFWAANVTTAAQAITVLKRVVRVLARRVL